MPFDVAAPDAAPALWEGDPPAGSAARAVIGWAAALIAAGGIIALCIAARDSYAIMSPLALAQFVAALATLPALAGIIWLLSQRTSTAEAERFGRTARAMRAEADALGRTVAVLGDTIEQRREQLSEQVRLLTQLGDAATSRLATIGRDLSEEIDQADVHARSLAQATGVAQEALATLLATLPRAQDEARRLGEAIDGAGRTAGERAAALDAQVAALAVRGREAESLVGGATERLTAHLQRMDGSSERAGERLELVTAQAITAVDSLLERTAAAIDEAHRGIAAQGEATLAMVAANQSALDHAARESADALAERINLVELMVERITAELNRQSNTGHGLFTDLEGGIARVEQQFAELQLRGAERTQTLAATISALQSSADAMTVALEAGDATATRTIATTEALLTALDAATREMDETMPDAMDRLDARVDATRQVIASAKPELLALVTASESTHAAIEAVAQVVAEQRRTVESLAGTLNETLGTGRAKADAIGHALDEATERASGFAEEAAPRLLEALLRVRDTAALAADNAREALAKVIPDAAGDLEDAAAAALRRATEHGVDAQVTRLSAMAETAVATASLAAERLDRQVQEISASLAVVDDRIEQARTEREEHDRDSFARRASLLIEALNSASIDLTRTLAPEVSDSAWAAYLKGDRGVFTRRAVRLLDSAEQRDIARLYDDDAGFREQVNRYIHDFEAMLRTILAQRDGSPLGVTLLSSDMGKLYVALAQAIERLR